jgi:hypothetical protein
VYTHNGTTTLDNTIVAANTADDGADDVAGAGISAASSNNLVGVDETGSLTNGVNGTIVFGPGNPGLGALAANGGPTQTIALLASSPAIDAGSNSIPGITVPTTDQRGALRGPAGLDAGTRVDIGAYEASSSYLVTTTATTTDIGTLRTAIDWAGAGTNTNPAAATNPAPNTLVLSAAGNYVLAALDLPTLDSDLAAIGSAVVTAGGPISITIDLGPATYQNVDGNGHTLPIDVTAPAGTSLTLNSPPSGTATLYDLVDSGTVIIQGQIAISGESPALVVVSGQTTATGVTLVTATDAPTIQVQGGALVVRSSTVEQTSTTTTQPAIQVTGGSVDLGTTSSPGGNVLNVNGAGGFLQDTTSGPVWDEGDTLEVDAAPLPSSHLSRTALASSAGSSVYGQSVTLTATVQAANPTDGTPTGSVDFVDTTIGADLGTVSLSGGVASLITAALATGPQTITAHYLGDSTFAFSINTLTQTVSPAPLTVTANPASKVYGQPNPAFSASYGGFVLGQGPSVLSGTLTFSTTATAASHVQAGGYPITLGGLTASNYAITFVNGTLTIAPAPLTITAANQTMVYGGSMPALRAGFSGFVNGDTTASLATPPALATVPANSHAGTYAITASGAVEPDYSITYVNGALTITPAPLTITANHQSKLYGAPLPTLTASYSGFVNSDTPARLTTQPTLSTPATAASLVGSYAITASGAVDPDYCITYVNGTVTINPQTAVSATYTGLLYVATASATTSTATVTLSATIKDSSGGAGNVTNATVTFVNRADGSTIAGPLPVSLISSTDITTGTASYNWSVNIGTNSSESFTIGIVVGNDYSRNSASDDAVVTVSKPQAGSATGGGYLVNTSSAGLVPGDPGAHTNFGFNAKNNSSGLLGQTNLVVRYQGHV